MICKHCGAEFSPAQVDAEKAALNKNGAIGCGLLIALILAVAMCSSGRQDPSTGADGAKTAAAVPASLAEAKAMEQKNAARIAALLRQAKSLPTADVDGNLRLYRDLVSLAPANADFVARRDRYQTLADNAAVTQTSPIPHCRSPSLVGKKAGSAPYNSFT